MPAHAGPARAGGERSEEVKIERARESSCRCSPRSFVAGRWPAARRSTRARGGPGQRLDPWENWNRKVFAFNEELDRAVLKPVATAYTDVVPQPVRVGVDNFFNNFADAWSAINNLLQGKVAGWPSRT